jgi:hypothetical protein
MTLEYRKENEGKEDKGGEPRSHFPVAYFLFLFVAVAILLLTLHSAARAARLTVDLGHSPNVVLVGAVQRWDSDGNHRRPVDTKAKIDSPFVDAKAAMASGNQWVFEGLLPGKYDLVILAKDRLRIEGFDFVPVKESDAFFPGNATTDDETREFIIDDIGKSQHYENKVVPLCMGGDKKAVRVLMMLIRDKTTSYEADFPDAATIRHEVWQYSWNYGAWQKEKRTKVLDRVLLHRDELRKWTWLWDARLGGIEVDDPAVSIKYDLPTGPAIKKLKGLYPN